MKAPRIRVRKRPPIDVHPRTAPHAKTFLMTLRQFNYIKLENNPPRVVGLHFVPGKGWMVEAEDRKLRPDRRKGVQLGKKINGSIHLSFDEYKDLNDPMPIAFRRGLVDLNFDERRKRTRRKSDREKNNGREKR